MIYKFYHRCTFHCTKKRPSFDDRFIYFTSKFAVTDLSLIVNFKYYFILFNKK